MTDTDPSSTPVSVIELAVNIDDAAAEVIGDAQLRLMEAGALDAWTIPIGMKKQRPGVMLCALCEASNRDTFARLMLRLTGSFGVRFRAWDRMVLERSHEVVRTRLGAVRLKIGRLDGEVVVAQPEYEDVKKIADAVGVPVRDAMQAAHAAAEERPRGAAGEQGMKLPENFFLFMGIALVGFWFLMRMNRKGGKGVETVLRPEEQIDRLRESRGMHGDLEKLMAEIDDLAKRVGQRLDTKAHEVEHLIAEADERIAELRRLQGETPTTPSSPAPPPPTIPRAAPRFTSTAKPAAATISDDPLTRSVYDLYDAGHAPSDIARRLNEHVGKVELILALRKV